MPIAGTHGARDAAAVAPLARFHTDAVQGFLKVPFKAKDVGAGPISIFGTYKSTARRASAASLHQARSCPLPAFIPRRADRRAIFRLRDGECAGDLRVWRGTAAATDAAADHRQTGRGLRASGAGDFCRRFPGLVRDAERGSAAHCEPVVRCRACGRRGNINC